MRNESGMHTREKRENGKHTEFGSDVNDDDH
jgi:hypothetical protein